MPMRWPERWSSPGGPPTRKWSSVSARMSSPRTGASTAGRSPPSCSTIPSPSVDLEAIVHPEVRAEIAARLVGESSGERHRRARDSPLGRRGRDPMVRSCRSARRGRPDATLCLERLVDLRQMDRSDAEARIANQVTRSERIAKADFVIMNMGTLDELEEMVRRAWEWMEGLRDRAKQR